MSTDDRRPRLPGAGADGNDGTDFSDHVETSDYFADNVEFDSEQRGWFSLHLMLYLLAAIFGFMANYFYLDDRYIFQWFMLAWGYLLASHGVKIYTRPTGRGFVRNPGAGVRSQNLDWFFGNVWFFVVLNLALWSQGWAFNAQKRIYGYVFAVWMLGIAVHGVFAYLSNQPLAVTDNNISSQDWEDSMSDNPRFPEQIRLNLFLTHLSVFIAGCLGMLIFLEFYRIDAPWSLTVASIWSGLVGGHAFYMAGVTMAKYLSTERALCPDLRRDPCAPCEDGFQPLPPEKKLLMGHVGLFTLGSLVFFVLTESLNWPVATYAGIVALWSTALAIHGLAVAGGMLRPEIGE